jgi:polysaccharide biosynthesis transport protein
LEKRYFIIIQRWLWLLLAAALLAGLVVYAATRNQTELYEARTRLMVGPGLDALNPDLNAMRAGGRLMQTYAEMAHTEPFLHNVRHQLDLPITPKQLAGRINIRLNQETQILTIEARDEDPLQAALIAYTVGEQLLALSPAAGNGPEMAWHNQMRRQVVTLEAEVAAIESALRPLEEQLIAATDPETERQIRAEIARERGRLLETHRALTNLYEVLQSANSNQVTLIEPVGDVTAVRSNRGLQVLLGAASGLMLSLAAVLAFAYLSDTVESPSDLAEMTQLPVVAVIPRHSHFLSPTYRSLVAQVAPTSAATGAYQVLGARLMYSDAARPLQTILCSGLPGSTETAEVVANLGLVLAQAGNRVILVDANLRDPSLSELFAVPRQPGLVEYLSGRTPEAQILSLGWAPGLALLTSGQGGVRASTFLPSSRLDELLQQLRAQADKVLVLGPPLLTSGHTLFLAARVDGVLLVTNKAQTRYGALNEAIFHLNGIGANILGTVLKNSGDYISHDNLPPRSTAIITRPSPPKSISVPGNVSVPGNGQKPSPQPVKAAAKAKEK